MKKILRILISSVLIIPATLFFSIVFFVFPVTLLLLVYSVMGMAISWLMDSKDALSESKQCFTDLMHWFVYPAKILICFAKGEPIPKL